MTTLDVAESVLEEIGFGRWQWLILLTACLNQMTTPVQQLGSPIVSAPVPFRCSYSKSYITTNMNSTANIHGNNRTDYPSECLPKIIHIDQEENYLHNSSVVMVSQMRATALPSCPEIEYDTSVFESSVIMEWNLVCEDASWRPLYQMTYSIGSIIGALFCGQLSDWMGRKRAIQTGGILTATSVLLITVVPWYSAMIVFRIFAGLGNIVMMLPAYTLVAEVSPSRSRTLSTIVPGLVFFVSLSVLGGIGYLVPRWKTILLICNSPLLLMIVISFIMDESPRWLLQAGRATEAVAVLKRAAAWNKVTLSPSTTAKLNSLNQLSKDEVIQKFNDSEDEDKNTLLKLVKTCFSSPGMRLILLVSPLVWFMQRSLYLGIVINANNFTNSNPFEYVAISGAMGATAMVLTLPLSVKLSRKVFLESTLSIGGILMALDMAIPRDIWWLRWLLVMIAFCCVCGAFQINYIQAAELYPTVIRTRGFTFNSLIGSIGEMSVPLVTDIVVQYYWWAPGLTFGLLGIIGALLISFLPETVHSPMPETLEDVECRHRRKKKEKHQDPEEGATKEANKYEPEITTSSDRQEKDSRDRKISCDTI